MTQPEFLHESELTKSLKSFSVLKYWRGAETKSVWRKSKKNPTEFSQTFHLKVGWIIGLFCGSYLILILKFHPELSCLISSCSVGNSNSALPHASPAHVLPRMNFHYKRSNCFRLIRRSHKVTCCWITVSKLRTDAFILSQGWKRNVAHWTQVPSTADICQC